MKCSSALLSICLLFTSHCFADWNPDDDTFDPSITETVANGSTRIGDPSPFRQDGYDIVGYTYLQAKSDENSGVLVWVSLIVPFVPAEMEKPGGASMFLTLEQAETLQSHLAGAIESAGDQGRNEVGVVFENPSYETWKVFVDGSTDAPVVLHRTRGDVIDQFRLAVNPAKKMLDALTYYIAEGKKLAAGKK
ncbi:hypothetical protein VSU19_12000 [Verrucomicrobiales bacterium BCK34]|nr:hypothetical protein [Verrucomicrobiales bacterium BCK34]